MWNSELDIYVRCIKGNNDFVPFLYQGQYYDKETQLAYNRFRYYDPKIGMYISQDPIGLMGGIVLYGYVGDVNGWLDVLGLAPKNDFGIPSIKDFGEWFNNMFTSDFDKLWKQKGAGDIIESRLRYPGKKHEWLMVSRADVFKSLGVKFEKIRDLRTLTKDVKFVNPIGKHGGLGSTKAHNEILEIIDTSLDYKTFIRRLNNWADYRLKGGADALPDGLKIKHH
ncbi:RHS repeat domain-containing protein [Myroides profundi]|uniref:RHS repeat-associated core domain-containing protein n=1 Tax=Myroides profundi TaxID=480520 RepID=A0AAJ5BER7_MYRPR|nr:RHS repeat-associated core domain-containing protein [Myroides profundi]AJH15241.1 type IV secretion protein Rhs [Myroides profundi]SER25020.1 RHS repeat-associated core domain-containing protein [Myroides profundi]